MILKILFLLDKNELLLKYFFLCGIPEDIKNKYKTDELKEMNNLSPEYRVVLNENLLKYPLFIDFLKII